jgi:hypothetical protein
VSPDEDARSETSSEIDPVIEFAGRILWMASQSLVAQGHDIGFIIAGIAHTSYDSGVSFTQWEQIVERSRAYGDAQEAAFVAKENQ